MILKRVFNENIYITKNWNKEETYRYVVQINNKIVEGSFFAHYLDDLHIKNVVEIPTSFGCSIGCKHCASSMLSSKELLTIEEIVEVFETIVREHNLKKDEKFLVTFTGIGETALIKQHLKNILNILKSYFSNIYFVIGTQGFDCEYILFLDSIASDFHIKNIQISYLHYDTDKLCQIIPNAKKLQYDFNTLLKTISKIKNTIIRINYVAIEGYNNDVDHINKLIELLRPIRNKVLIRVSNLHETAASTEYCLNPTSMDRLEKIQQQFSDTNIDAYVFAVIENDNLNCGQLAYTYTD